MAHTLSASTMTLAKTAGTPSDLIQRIDVSLLYPPFLHKLLLTLKEARLLGQDYIAVSAYRDRKEQAALYAQGRTKPGKRVTNAPAGFSAHNWGIAVDVAADVSPRRGLQPSWDSRHYEVLKQAGAKHGLQVGVPGLQDDGHIQLPLTHVLQRKEVDIFTTLNGAYASGGMLAAWAQLDVWGFGLESQGDAVASGAPPSVAPKG